MRHRRLEVLALDVELALLADGHLGSALRPLQAGGRAALVGGRRQQTQQRAHRHATKCWLGERSGVSLCTRQSSRPGALPAPPGTQKPHPGPGPRPRASGGACWGALLEQHAFPRALAALRRHHRARPESPRRASHSWVKKRERQRALPADCEPKADMNDEYVSSPTFCAPSLVGFALGAP